MYRESILGLALAATLAEMQPRLTARQEDEVWRIFDASMETTVAAAPLMSRVSVFVPPPSSVSGGGAMVVSTAMPQLHIPAQMASDDAATTTVTAAAGAENPSPPSLLTETQGQEAAAAAAPFDDSSIAFPVYRRHDDMWTVLLKEPTVVVRDEFGKSEKMQLDYLKVRLKVIEKPTGGKRKRAKKN